MTNKIFIGFIKGYQQLISPFLPPSCRFYPSCSEYSIQALKRYSFPHALLLTLKRILRCHPFCRGGYDPLK